MTDKPSGPGPQCPPPSTTFVHADANSFKELVQRLTGPHDTATSSSKPTGCKRPTFKLHERRHGSRSKLTIAKPSLEGAQAVFSGPRPGPSPSPSPGGHVCSPTLSPATGLSSLDLNEEEEEKAIKERRFYLHPSPQSSQTKSTVEPELLQLFPLTSSTRGSRMPPL